ncbi:MAG: methyl-accepting chemotaxis protein [Clostridiales Family XIII bacterium]|jgi:methyl-accepting chemotaxis protein|nr:methyl-accepting chemotaxis protein [Clostridiales Family XIII bacterium]
MKKNVGSLRRTIMAAMLSLVLLVAVVLGVSGGLTDYREASAHIDRLIAVSNEAYAEGLGDYLTMAMSDVRSIAESGAITAADLTYEQKQGAITRIAEARGDIASIYVVSAAGVAVNDAEAEDVGENYANEPFFIEGMTHQGGWIDVPYWDEWNDMVTMTISYRIDGALGFSGLVCIDIAYDTVRNLTTSNTLGETGYSFLMDADGIMRSIENEQLVIDEVAATELYPGNTEVNAFLVAALAENAAQSGDLTAGGERIRLYVSTLSSTGWKYVTVIKTDEFMDSFENQLRVSIVTAGLCLLVAVLLALVLSRRIANPISAMRKRMERLAEGDLHSPLPDGEGAGEVGLLYGAMETSLHSLSSYVTDISYSLERLAKGDLTSANEGPAGAAEYWGDYLPIRHSMDELRNSLGEFFAETRGTTRLVAKTSVQLAAASEELAGTASEKAAAIDRTAQRFREIRDVLAGTAEETLETLEKTRATQRELTTSSKDIDMMLAAMREIGEISESVIKIVGEIDDIAFLSNILSLNAAIEAARAGQHGRGFAVVADEVRELAGKSGEAAQYTGGLIAKSSTAVEKGRTIANETRGKIDGVLELLDRVTELMERIEGAIAGQAAAAKDIYEDINRLNKLVQSDTAMSEETASASTELSAGMSKLHDDIARFKTDE